MHGGAPRRAGATMTLAGPLVGADEQRWLQHEVGAGYELVRLLGRGASATVYLALDRALQRYVAIKALLPELAATDDWRARFRREALTNARLAHPGIVPVFAFVETAGTSASVMRYVPGVSLAYHVWRGEPLPVRDACAILADLAGAVDYAHRRRVVHRDIKPENVLLDADTGRPMLTDFGVALATSLDAMAPDEIRAERGRLYGTASFVSPEQASGDFDVDGRADLYALGVLGYAMLSGTLPFTGSSLRELLSLHVNAPPPPLASRAPHVPEAVAAIVARCLAKLPEDRFADGASLRDALLAAGVHPERLAPRPGLVARLARRLGRR